MRNRLIDTASIAMYELVPFHRSGYANQHPPSLDEVCAFLNLPILARHTAEGDAFMAAEVFLHLCGKIRRRLQNRRLNRRTIQLRDLPVTQLSKQFSALQRTSVLKIC